MWLKQFQAYQISFDFLKDLAPNLEKYALLPCAAHSRQSFGWKPLDNDQFYEEIQGFSHCCFAKEERILPAAVIQHEVAHRSAALEKERGSALKKHEKQQLKQDTEFSLLPKAFCVQKKYNILFDNHKKRMFIPASSSQQADLILSFIVKTLTAAVDIQALSAQDSLAMTWKSWLTQPEHIPHFLSFSDRMQWIDEDNSQKQIRCQGYDWEHDSAQDWLNQGFLPQEMSFIWRDMIQFQINSKFQFKRVSPLPHLKEQLEANEIDEKDSTEQLSNLLLIGHQFQLLLDDLAPLYQVQDIQVKEFDCEPA